MEKTVAVEEITADLKRGIPDAELMEPFFMLFTYALHSTRYELVG